MVCYHPMSCLKITYPDHSVKISGFVPIERLPVKELNRRRSSDFWFDGDICYQFIEIPCGQCIGCRLERSRNWAVRCVHEASLYKENCFLTLTYDDLHLPSKGSLVKKDLQDFWKRLRKAIEPNKLRYFACGEYGEQFQRPHYHACVFGYFPSDAKLYTIRFGSRLFISPLIGRLWPFGFHTIGDVTFDSAAYVARYVLKKVNGDNAANYYDGRESEYVVMSRRPGIAKDWILKYYNDVYPNDYIVVRDKIKCKPPRYYDNIYDLECNGDLEYIKNKRCDVANHKSYSSDELYRKEKCKIVTVKKRLKRNYEEKNI